MAVFAVILAAISRIISFENPKATFPERTRQYPVPGAAYYPEDTPRSQGEKTCKGQECLSATMVVLETKTSSDYARVICHIWESHGVLTLGVAGGFFVPLPTGQIVGVWRTATNGWYD